MSKKIWAPHTWRKKSVSQMPKYPDQKRLAEVESILSDYPPLVFAGEARALKARLAQAVEGKAFLLQGGDCAESFGAFNTDAIRDNLRILLQMAVILTFGKRMPVIKVGRVAGQFAKPRSKDTETRGKETLPTYRGDIINSFDFDAKLRIPDPDRMLRAYAQSAATLNLLRAFAHGGYADLHQVHAWNLDFVRNSPQSVRYENIAIRIEDALRFMEAVGITSKNSEIRNIEFYTSHEALLLPYEEAMTRQDSTTARLEEKYKGDWYGCSAHLLWVGERTRQLDGAHVEYLRGVGNPIAVKIGPTASVGDLLKLSEVLNPENEAGRLTFIIRMGYEKVAERLPPLLKGVSAEGKKVLWVSDPMHGNGEVTSDGYKTRHFKNILSETRSFAEVCKAHSIHPGGVHFELTGKDVVECLGGDQKITAEHLGKELYETLCDPRLNASQALELAFQVCY